MRATVLTGILVTALVASGQAVAATKYVFEELGEPVRSLQLSFRFVTQDPDGYYIAWTGYEGPRRHALLGVRTDNGECIWVDLDEYGRSHIQMTKGEDGSIYLYSGNPGHFLKYDVGKRELVDLGMPAEPASYWLGSAIGPDGRFYVGSYPKTHLVCLDPKTGSIEGLGQMATDEREAYIIHPTVSDDNVVYCPVGLHHMELWAYDMKTRTKKQVLPEGLMELAGSPKVWTGTDGQVYAQAGGTTFRCTFDGIIEVDEVESARRPPRDMTAGDREVGAIDEEGKLELTHVTTRDVSLLQTQYEGRPAHIYSVSCERDGRIWGGSGKPSSSFYYDTKTGELVNVGRVTGGRIQIYDTISLPQGLFLSSYSGAHLNMYDPDRPREGGVNPRPIGSFSASHMQERPYQWALGPDGMLYIGTRPIKGHLGGALVGVNPSNFSYKVWRDVIPNQSVFYVAPVPETHEMFCSSSISGGSSAIATEKEAYVFLWDIKREQVSFRAQPVPGITTYGMVARAKTGVIYGLAGEKYYAFDARQRKVVHVGDLPGRSRQFPGMCREPVGPKGLLYGFADDALFAIDPADHSLEVLTRHESIEGARGPYVTQDGVVYYGSGPTLMRCRPEETAS